MPNRAPSPLDRYDELAEAATLLKDTAAVAELVCDAVTRQEATGADGHGYTVLHLTPLIASAFSQSVFAMGQAAEAVDLVLRRHSA